MTAAPEDPREWTWRSRLAQGLSECVTDDDVIAALAILIQLAKDTEKARCTERAALAINQPLAEGNTA